MQKTDLATDIFRKVAEVAAENIELKRTLKIVHSVASQGLHQASEYGATRWRESLDRILEITREHSAAPEKVG